MLREYARYKSEHTCSLLQYMEVQAKSDYQLEVPTGAFSFLLLSGRLLLIFDGLDELIETADRLAIKSAV